MIRIRYDDHQLSEWGAHSMVCDEPGCGAEASLYGRDDWRYHQQPSLAGWSRRLVGRELCSYCALHGNAVAGTAQP